MSNNSYRSILGYTTDGTVFCPDCMFDHFCMLNGDEGFDFKAFSIYVDDVDNEVGIIDTVNIISLLSVESELNCEECGNEI